MANATYETLELHFIIKPEWTEAYVLLSPASDGTLGVGGWHFKHYPPDMPVSKILEYLGYSDEETPALWPHKAPPVYERMYRDSLTKGREISIDIDDGTP